MLLNRPVPPPPLGLVNAAAEAVVDESISIRAFNWNDFH